MQCTRTLGLAYRMAIWMLLLFLDSVSSAPEAVIFAQAGNSVTIPREKSQQESDKVYVNWYFVNKTAIFFLISRNPQQNTFKKENTRMSMSADYSLIISPVQEFGIFKCEQHELLKSHEQEYKLYPVKMPNTLVLVAGADLTLSCELDAEGYKLARLKVECFRPDGTKLKIQKNENKITVTESKVSRKHSGLWSCLVQYFVFSNAHELNATTDLTVIDLAPSSPDPVYTSVSSPHFTIPCAMSSQIPWSTVNATGLQEGSWKFTPFNSQTQHTLLTLQVNPRPAWRVKENSNSTLMERELKDHDLSVQSSKVSVYHRGIYTCSLIISSRQVSSKVTVDVLQILSSAIAPILEGGTVNLTCTLGHPLTPDLKVKWTPPRSSSLPQLGPPPHSEKLLLSTVWLQHSGTWTCELRKNGTLLTSARVKLEIVKAPVNIWLIVATTGGVLVFILLLVIAVVIVRRRRKVIKHRRRRMRFCCCEKPQLKGFYKT